MVDIRIGDSFPGGDFCPFNPLDDVADAFDHQGWDFKRPEPDKIAFEIEGHWSCYLIWLHRSVQRDMLDCVVRISAKVANQRRVKAYELLCRVNSQMALGHFELCADSGMLIFRHSLPISALGSNLGAIEDVLKTALDECERFFPAFQLVLSGRSSPESALRAAIFETVGVA
ncbi:MAG: YbjN domain-containing protein [Pseudomonadota bacterium]